MAVKVTPKAARARIQGLAAEADGSHVIKVAVTAPPEGGKANAAVIRLLAKAWGLPPSRLAVANGAGDRRKVIAISGDPEDLAEVLAAWCAAQKS